MRKLLTDVLIKTTKSPSAGRLEIADERCSGLSFRVTSNNARSWSFRFRDPRTAKTRRFGLGDYPDVSLADARAKAAELRKAVAGGENPLDVKRQMLADAPSRTVASLAKRYLEEHAKRHKRSYGNDERNLRLHVLPYWKDREYGNISRSEVVELLERMITAGTSTNANRVQSLVSRMFNFAIDVGLMEHNPCYRLKKRGVERQGTRVLNNDEIRLFWNACVAAPVSRSLGLCLRLLLLTGCRASEGAELARVELGELTQNPQWIIPRDRVKNKRDHLLPLSTLANETIADAISLSSGELHVFPSPTKINRSIKGHSLTVAMSRLIAAIEGQEGAAKSLKENPPSPHDLRRTVGTRLASLGVSLEDRAAVLNHKPRTVTQLHYDLYDRAKEKRAALELWANSLQMILTAPVSRTLRAAYLVASDLRIGLQRLAGVAGSTANTLMRLHSTRGWRNQNPNRPLTVPMPIPKNDVETRFLTH